VDNDGNALLTGALYFNSTSNQMFAWSGSAWVAAGSTGSGDVLGPASSTDNAIARFDGTTGKIVQNSAVTISDAGGITAGAYTSHSFINGDIHFDGTNSVVKAYNGFTVSNLNGFISFGGSNGNHGDVRLIRDAAQTLAQRNGTNPQTFRLYNTYTDGSNYERGFFRYNTNVLEIGHEAAGTGDGNRSVRLIHANLGKFVTGVPGFAATKSDNSGLYLRGAGQLGWTNGSNADTTADTGVGRDSAAVVRVTNGSTGLGSLKAANIDFTGNLTKNGAAFSAGAKGGGSDAVFYENDQTVTTNYTITSGKNAGTFGPIAVGSGVTVTVPSGSVWTVI
jgi:hypothetical protein